MTDVDTKDYADVAALLPSVADVRDDQLRDGVVRTWRRAIEMSGLGDDVTNVPLGPTAPQERLMDHIETVLTVARQLAETWRSRDDDVVVDDDLLTAACLLHDVDKVLMVERGPDGQWRKSAAAARIGHGNLGAMLCAQEGMPEVIAHLVISHSALTPVEPQGVEGMILHYADFFSADLGHFAAGAPLVMHRLKMA
jgi:putative nucleotidyltransferase with HDIG domain